jgi:pilus assembly protein Flp/PilA
LNLAAWKSQRFLNYLRIDFHIRNSAVPGELNMLTQIRHFAGDESGATAIEYGLIAALVSVAAIGALTTMGNTLNTLFTTVSNAMNTASGG